MNKLSKHEQGYSVLEIVLLIVVIGILFFVALYVRSASMNTAHTYNTATADSSSPAPIKQSKKITTTNTATAKKP